MFDLLLSEDSWFPVAAAIAVLGLAWPCFAWRGQPIPVAVRAGVCLFFGLYIGVMGIGHLVAVTIRTVLGTLPPDARPSRVFLIGFALTIPTWALVAITVQSLLRQIHTSD
jgi:hypothetical protein